jgi:REP element-mobilizing transposase RayT
MIMQLHLFSGRTRFELVQTRHGGDERRGQRKIERPVSTRRPMHVTLHSDRARGPWSLLRHQQAVRDTVRVCAKRSGIQVYDFANVGSHLHLLVRARRREDFRSFLRSLAGIVARVVTGAKRGRRLQGGAFWRGLAWSRLVSWGRDYKRVRHYIFRNRVEGNDGVAARQTLELASNAWARIEADVRFKKRRKEENPDRGAITM